MSGTKIIFSQDDINKVKEWSKDYPSQPVKRTKRDKRREALVREKQDAALMAENVALGKISETEKVEHYKNKFKNIVKERNASLAGERAKDHTPQVTKTVAETNKHDPRMPKQNQHKRNHFNRPEKKHENVVTEPKRPPAPIKWRTRNIVNGTHAGGVLMWAYKRNYKVELIDSAHGIFPYTVNEISDPQNPKLVLKLSEGGFKDIDEAKGRCENIIRILGRGLDLRLTEHEKNNGVFHKENCKFVEYEQAVPQPVKITEEIRCSEAEQERILKEQLANMKWG